LSNSKAEILERIIDEIPEKFDTSEGSFFKDLETPVAIELEKTYQKGDEILDNAFVTTAEEEHLISRGADFGVIINPASYAKCIVHVKGSAGAIFQVAHKVASETIIFENLVKIEFQSSDFDCTLDNTTNTVNSVAHGLQNKSVIQFTGTLPAELSTGLDYYVIARTDDTFQISLSEGGTPIAFSTVGATVQISPITLWKEAEVQAVSGGLSGNVPIGTITKFPVTLPAITDVYNFVASTGGLPAEDLEEFRQRTLAKIQDKGSSGNIADYKNWTLEVDGVGAVRVRPLTNDADATENGHVQLVIVGTDFLTADPTLCDAVELIIGGVDQYDEDRLAPIGADINCKGAEEVAIDIYFDNISFTGDWTLAIVPLIEAAVKEYFAEIALEIKSNTHNLDVNYPKMNNIMFDIPEITGYDELLLNSGVLTIEIENDQVPVLGTVTKSV